MGKLEASLNKTERELEALAAKARAADKALDDLSGGFNSVSHSSQRASNGVSGFNFNLRDTIATAQKAKRVFDTLYPPIDHLVRSFQGFKRFQNTNGGFLTQGNAFRKFAVSALLIDRALLGVRNRLLGVNKAIELMPSWQKRFLNFSAKVTGATLAMTALFKTGKVLGFLSKRFSALGLAGDKIHSAFWRVNKLATTTDKRFSTLARTFLKTWVGIEKGGTKIHNSLKRVDNTTKGLAQTLVGFAIAKRGLSQLTSGFGLLGAASGRTKLIMAGIAAAIAVIGPLAEITAKGLRMLSNGFNLVWNAVKQLSGGLLAIPGVFATIMGSFVPLISTFARFGKVFEGVFKAENAEEMAEAIAALPEHLRGFGKRLGEIKKSLSEISEAGFNSFIGPESVKELDVLENALKGPLLKNFQLINNAARLFRRELINVATDGKNITGMNQVFQSSRKFIDNMRNALEPFTDGMRDLVVVGSQFFADFTSGSEKISQRFAEWAALNRGNGNLRKWMDDAVEGAKDLLKGTLDLTKALWKLLTLFADDSGANALDRYADKMKQFNEWVDKSKADGVLKSIGDAVKGIKFDRLNELANTVKDLYVPFKELYQAVAPLVQEISSAFKDTFIPLVKVATQILEVFVEGFKGLGPVLGWLLGISAGIKAITYAMKPLMAFSLVGGGLLTSFKGLASIFDKITPGADKATAAIGKMESGFGKAKASLAGFLTKLGYVATAFAAVYLGIHAARDQIDNFNETLKEGEQNAADYKDSLRSAFQSDSGLTGKTVFDTVTNQMSDMRAQLDKEASQVPDWIDNMQELWFGGSGKDSAIGSGRGPFSWAQGSDFNAMQKAAQDAERAKKKFDDLGLSSADLATIVTGSKSAFEDFNATVRNSGENGNEAADALQKQRDVFEAMQSDFKNAGQGSAELVNAIVAIGDAGSDSASKLSALRSALDSLGFDKSGEYEAAFAFSDAIRKLGDEAANAVDASAPLADIFGPDGVLATSGPAAVNAENLYNIVKDAVDAFQDTAVESGDIAGAWQTLQDSLGKTADAFKTDLSNVQGLVADLTGNDYIVSLLLSVEGDDKVRAQIASILLEYEQQGRQGEIQIPLVPNIDKAALQSALDAAYGPGKAAVGENTLTISDPNVTPQGIRNLQEQIPGLQVPGGPKPKPAEIAVEPVPADPKPGQQGPPVPAEPTQAPTAVTPPEAKPPIADIPKAAPAPDTAAAEEAIDGVKGKLDELNGTEVSITGLGEIGGQLETLSGQAETAATAFQTFATGIATSMQEAQSAAQAGVDQINSVLASAAGSANSYGVMVGMAFANGLGSMVGVVGQAAARLGQAVNDNLKPGSPTKKGPLSGKGWVGYSGTKTGKAYADALGATASDASAAGAHVAGGVASSMGPEQIGKLLGGLNDFLGIGRRLVEVFSDVSEKVFSAMKLMSDPLGEGTFFGSQLPFARDYNTSDKDLQRQREDELQSKLSGAVADGVKDELSDQRKEDAKIAKDQQKAADGQIAAADKNATTAKTSEKEEDKPRPLDLQENVAQTLADRIADANDPTKTKQNVDEKNIDLSAPENAPKTRQGADLSGLTEQELNEISTNTSLTAKSQDEIIRELRAGNGELDGAIRTLKDVNASTEDTVNAANVLDKTIQDQKKLDTPAARATAQSLESIQSSATSNKGINRTANPIDTVSDIAGNASNIAGEIFNSIESVFGSIAATKDLGDTFVRGIENSADLERIVDNLQQYLETAATIASAVASGLGAAASIASAVAGADPSGGASGAATALAGASQIASLISAGLATVNGIIDLTQEVASILGKYGGEFLGFLTGGAGGQLLGDVKFLLDQNDGTLKTYSKDNPEDKRVFSNPFSDVKTAQNSQQPQIGSINVYGGPGQDPREMTNEMMFAVAAASSGAGNFN